jgi:hypothetical protein
MLSKILKIMTPKTSVADPWHLSTDPDDDRRIRIRSSCLWFREAQKHRDPTDPDRAPDPQLYL